MLLLTQVLRAAGVSPSMTAPLRRTQDSRRAFLPPVAPLFFEEVCTTQIALKASDIYTAMQCALDNEYAIWPEGALQGRARQLHVHVVSRTVMPRLSSRQYFVLILLLQAASGPSSVVS